MFARFKRTALRHLLFPDAEVRIIFAVPEEGIKVYSDKTGKVETIARSGDRPKGVAWDPVNQQVYYSGPSSIYKAKIDGSGIQTVVETQRCKLQCQRIEV